MAKVKTPKGKDKNERAQPSVLLITNGYRTRVKADGTRVIATLKTKPKLTTPEQVMEVWENAIAGVKEKDYVVGAGESGIFSGRFAQQVAQITELENVWCPSVGLGMVCLGAAYPQYDMGDYETSIKQILEPGVLKERDWWNFVCDLSGNSLTSVIKDGVANGRRIVMALPHLQYGMFRDDLRNLIEGVGIESLRDHLRIVGPELEMVLPPKLTPCLMPYDRDALNRLVPGTRSHGTRRLAKLFLDVCPPLEDGVSDPLKDYEKLKAAYNDKTRAPLVYRVDGEDKGTKLRKLPADEFASVVNKYAKVAGAVAMRIVRMMREDGISATFEGVDSMLAKAARAAKAAKAEKAAARQKD